MEDQVNSDNPQEISEVPQSVSSKSGQVIVEPTVGTGTGSEVVNIVREAENAYLAIAANVRQ